MFLVLPLTYLFIGGYTYIGTFIFSFAKQTPFDFYYLVAKDSIVEAIFSLVLASASFGAGWVVCRKIKLFRSKPKHRTSSGLMTMSFVASRRIRVTVVLINLLALITLGGGYGLSNIVESYGYASFAHEKNETLVKLHRILLPIASFSLAFLPSSILRLALVSVHAAMLLSIGTRSLGLLFFLYGAGFFVSSGGRMSIKSTVIILLGVYLFVWTLSIRWLGPMGFMNNLSNLAIVPSLNQVQLGINYITSFSVFGFSYAIENKQADIYAAMVSISPLPLSYHDATRMLSAQQLLTTSPMSSISIIHSLGYGFLILFYSFLGGLILFVSRSVSNRRFVAIMVFSVYCVAVFLSTQYNLRGFTRLIYLITFIAAALHFRITKIRV